MKEWKEATRSWKLEQLKWHTMEFNSFMHCINYQLIIIIWHGLFYLFSWAFGAFVVALFSKQTHLPTRFSVLRPCRFAFHLLILWFCKSKYKCKFQDRKPSRKHSKLARFYAKQFHIQIKCLFTRTIKKGLAKNCCLTWLKWNRIE